MVNLYTNSCVVLGCGLKSTELILMEVSNIKQSGDQRLSPDVPFSGTFSKMIYSPY